MNYLLVASIALAVILIAGLVCSDPGPQRAAPRSVSGGKNRKGFGSLRKGDNATVEYRGTTEGLAEGFRVRPFRGVAEVGSHTPPGSQDMSRKVSLPGPVGRGGLLSMVDWLDNSGKLANFGNLRPFFCPFYPRWRGNPSPLQWGTLPVLRFPFAFRGCAARRVS